MVTIAHLVEKKITQTPFIQEALHKGIINHAALAELLLPEIEKELKEPVKFTSINMSIRRFAEKIEKKELNNITFNQDSNVTIRSNLIEITIHKSRDIEPKIQSIYNLISYKNGDFLTITQGLHEIMIIIDTKFKSQILEIFEESEIKMILEELSSVTINIPLEAIETVGMFYIITKTLNWENINIIEIVSTLTEMTFIIKDTDVANAFNCLNKLIKEHQEK